MKKILYICIVAMFMLSACSTHSIVGGWGLVSYGSTSSQTPAAPIDFDTLIHFDEDGEVAGNVGCNTFNGDYKVDGNQVTFGSIVLTRMVCEEPIASQEAAVLKTFTGTATYDLDADTLTITSEDGMTSVVLEPWLETK
jgi:heat shock protein HslJ